MLVKKLMLSAMGTGLLWAAGLAGHTMVSGHPGLLLLAGQVRLSLGDRDGGLRWMQSAAQQDQAPSSADAVSASPAPAGVTAAKCPAKAGSRVGARGWHRASLVPVSIQVSPQDYARLMARTQRDFARRQHQLVRLSLEKAGLSQQTRVMVLQHMRDLPQPPLPSEPMHANP